MPVLHNRISNEELKARMLAETEPRTTVSFYKYFSIDDPKAFRDSLYVQFEKLKVFGRIYVAKEGINAQISVPQHNFDAFKAALFASHPALDQVRLNIALDDAPRDKCAHFREINGIAAAFQYLQKNYIPTALSFH